jgi:hypothetical protein
MSNTTRRQMLVGLIAGLSQAVGTVVLARSVLPQVQIESKRINSSGQPRGDLQERADQVLAELGACQEEGELTVAEFVNGGFRNGGGGEFRKGAFANGGGGGDFRKGGFANGGGGDFRNGGFANGGGGGFRNGGFANGGGFRNF